MLSHQCWHDPKGPPATPAPPQLYTSRSRGGPLRRTITNTHTHTHTHTHTPLECGQPRGPFHDDNKLKRQNKHRLSYLSHLHVLTGDGAPNGLGGKPISVGHKGRCAHAVNYIEK